MRREFNIRFGMDAIIWLLMLFMLSNCEKENITAREYPRLRTLEVTDISENGARFQAEITYRGSYDISRYGFVWSSDANPTLENSDKIEIGSNPESNSFSANISTSLIKDRSYGVRSFLETDDYIVYGDLVKFVSLGSSAPQITEYGPTLGTWGDTITIMGENFSNLSGTNKGYLGEVELISIFDSDTLLKFKIPPVPNTEECSLYVELSGNRATADEIFSYILPSIQGIDPTEAAYGDTIRIDVQDYNKDYMSVKFNEAIAQIVSFEDESIEVKVPCNLEVSEPLIIVESAGFTDQVTGFALSTPSFVFADAYSAYYGDTIIIEGENLNPEIAYNTVNIGSFPASVIEASSSTLKFLVPESLDLITSDLIVQSGAYAFDPIEFSLLVPEITTMAPEEITHPDDQILVSGRGFNTDLTYVTISLSHPNGSYLVSSEEIIEMTHDEILIGMNQEEVFRYLSITVTGEISIEIQTHAFDPVSSSTGILYQSTWTRKQNFPGARRRDAVAFTSANRGYYGTGSDWDIESIYRDFWTYDPSADTWTRIEDLPGEARWDAVAMTINGEGYVGLGSNFYTAWQDAVYYSDFYKYDPSAGWERMADFAGPGTSMAAAFSINTMGYVATGQYWIDDPDYYYTARSNDTWVYDALLDQWSQTVDFPVETNTAVGFNIGDSAYIYNYNDLYVLRDAAWVKIPAPTLSEEGQVGFSIGDVGYFGFGSRHGSRDNRLTEYHPLSYTWNDRPLEGRDPRAYASVFVIGNKAYIIGGDYSNELWEFDPSKPEL